ncbi:MAG: hypothetical protein DMG24_10135 [Acidobacteria bacterium]|nr:MAG: hypothetical protein DMG24_10135 [Acidobacteriota bacterium]
MSRLPAIFGWLRWRVWKLRRQPASTSLERRAGHCFPQSEFRERWWIGIYIDDHWREFHFVIRRSMERHPASDDLLLKHSIASAD